METKTCNTCGKDKPLEEYYRKGGWPIINCQSCRSSGKAKQDFKKKASQDFFKKYGIDYDAYDRMFTEQQGCCAICKSPDPKGRWVGSSRAFCVDHNHATGEVRGLLCNACNQGLGNFFDNIENLERAIVYLSKITVL
jgi:hypothetical protein